MLERYTERDLKKKPKTVEYTTTMVGWFYDPSPFPPLCLSYVLHLVLTELK